MHVYMCRRLGECVGMSSVPGAEIGVGTTGVLACAGGCM